MTTDPIAKLRSRCLALPEATERVSHGEPAFFARDKKLFVMASQQHHDDRLGFWCAAPPGETAALVSGDSRRFFVPPYVGHRGWLGVYLDVDGVDWAEIGEIVTDAYRCVAPKRLLALLDE